MDKNPIDQQGKKILELCKYSSFRILNGRVRGDTSGKFTRYPLNTRDSPSLIDYALCTPSLMNDIYSFSVLPFTGLSDHCCISTSIMINNRGEFKSFFRRMKKYMLKLGLENTMQSTHMIRQKEINLYKIY